MDPSYFFGALLGSFLAAQSPYGAYAQLRPGECDPAGRCNPWYDERRIPQHRFYSPPQYYPPPQRYADPPAPQQDPLGAQVKGEILQFCAQHPEEHFCGTLEAYLQKHPGAR